MTSLPSVSVVIPTTGRRELARAVQSARRQDGDHAVEIVVVNDSPDVDDTDGVDADIIVWTGGRRGGGHARNRGVQSASGRFVAFLDDDDEWTPNKLDDQLALARKAPDDRRVVVGGRHVHVAPDASTTSAPGPVELIAAQQGVAEYLFRRRRPSIGRASMYTSTLLCHRALAEQVPWREDLRRHQDWDWLVRLGDVDGICFVQAPTVVTRIQTGSSSSISASADWETSLAWAEQALDDDAVFVDFVSGQTLRYALNARSSVGVRRILRSILDRRRLPAWGPVVLGLAGFMPRHRLERLMTRRTAGAGPMDRADDGSGAKAAS
ncbi:glycosyltransferase family 2 protein [Microbacterium sp. NPDC055357]